MKKIILVVSTILILFTLNYLIIKKERTLSNGKTILLRLAPKDPRSLMQGDYMILRYSIAREINYDKTLQKTGHLVVSVDEKSEAHFIRLHKDEELKENEHLLLYRHRGRGRILLGAESFFFQEGTGYLYEKARYGELKVDDSGESVLVGLRDEDMKPITIEVNKKQSKIETMFLQYEDDFKEAADSYLVRKKFKGTKRWINTKESRSYIKSIEFNLGENYYDPKIVFILSDEPNRCYSCSSRFLIKKIKSRWYICKQKKL